MHEFSDVIGCEINIQKSNVFVYISNEQLKSNIRNT